LLRRCNFDVSNELYEDVVALTMLLDDEEKEKSKQEELRRRQLEEDKLAKETKAKAEAFKRSRRR